MPHASVGSIEQPRIVQAPTEASKWASIAAMAAAGSPAVMAAATAWWRSIISGRDFWAARVRQAAGTATCISGPKEETIWTNRTLWLARATA